MTVSPQQAVDLLSDMVRIESVTPWLIPTGSGEGALARFIARRLEGLARPPLPSRDFVGLDPGGEIDVTLFWQQ